MTTRREFIKNSVLFTGGAALYGGSLMCKGREKIPQKALVVSAAADDMLVARDYNPAAVGMLFNLPDNRRRYRLTHGEHTMHEMQFV